MEKRLEFSAYLTPNITRGTPKENTNSTLIILAPQKVINRANL